MRGFLYARYSLLCSAAHGEVAVIRVASGVAYTRIVNTHRLQRVFDQELRFDTASAVCVKPPLVFDIRRSTGPVKSI